MHSGKELFACPSLRAGLCEYPLLPSRAFCAAHSMIPGLCVIYFTFHWSLHGVLPAWGAPQDPGEGSLAYTAVWPGSFHLALCLPSLQVNTPSISGHLSKCD